MSTHILLGDVNTNFRLDPMLDPKGIETQLRNAATAGLSVEIPVTMQDRVDHHTLYVNPGQLAWWTIINLPDEDA